MHACMHARLWLIEWNTSWLWHVRLMCSTVCAWQTQITRGQSSFFVIVRQWNDTCDHPHLFLRQSHSGISRIWFRLFISIIWFRLFIFRGIQPYLFSMDLLKSFFTLLVFIAHYILASYSWCMRMTH